MGRGSGVGGQQGATGPLSPVLTWGGQSSPGGGAWLSPSPRPSMLLGSQADPAGRSLSLSMGCSFSLECLSLPSLPSKLLFILQNPTRIMSFHLFIGWKSTEVYWVEHEGEDDNKAGGLWCGLYYGLSVCVLPNSYVEILTPNGMVLGCEALGR